MNDLKCFVIVLVLGTVYFVWCILVEGRIERTVKAARLYTLWLRYRWHLIRKRK